MTTNPTTPDRAALREALERLLRQASRGGAGLGMNADMHEEAVVDAILRDPDVLAALAATPAPEAPTGRTADVLRDLLRDTAAHLDTHGCGCVWRIGVFDKEAVRLAAQPERTGPPNADWFTAVLNMDGAAQPEPSAPDGLDVERWSRVADDLYRALRSEHGHNEEHSADRLACLPVHLAMNRYREATR